jgi:6-phosphogluconate dehydrogenase
MKYNVNGVVYVEAEVESSEYRLFERDENLSNNKHKDIYPESFREYPNGYSVSRGLVIYKTLNEAILSFLDKIADDAKDEVEKAFAKYQAANNAVSDFIYPEDFRA